MKRRTLTLITLLIVVFALARLYYHLTDDFHLSNIVSPLPIQKELQIEESPEKIAEVQKILSQNFTYLGKGAQVYAFQSEDNQWVLKFFKFKHLRPSIFITLLPSIGPLAEIKERNQVRKNRKLGEVFQGHLIAYQHDPKYSGLAFIHLNPTVETLNLKVNLKDKLGRIHTLDLDPLVFVLQKKGKTLAEVFSELAAINDISGLIQKGKQVLDMYADEYLIGIWDRDHGVTHNIGFLGDAPFHLDIGKIAYDAKLKDPSFYISDLHRVADKMEDWMKTHDKENASLFHQAMDSHITEISPRFPLSPSLPAL